MWDGDGENRTRVLLTALESMIEPLSVLDPVRDDSGRVVDFRWIYVNTAARGATADPDPDSLLGDLLCRRMPVVAAALLPDFVSVIETGRPYQSDRIAAGSRTYAMRAVKVDGHLAISWKDISEQVAAESALAASAERFRTAMAAAPGGMAVVGLDRHFVEVNDALVSLVARDRGWLLRHGVPDILHPDEDERDARVRQRIMAGEVDNVTRECRFQCADGTAIWVMHAIGLMRDRDGRPSGFVSQMVNVTQARAAFEELEYRATHDPQTGLHNRETLVNNLRAILSHRPRAGRQQGVLFLDLDGLKRVNDEFGHAAGDELIVTMADRIRDCVRHEDQVARLGGDEFVVLLPSVAGLDEVVAIGDKIRQAVAQRVRIAEGDVSVTASAGATLAIPGEDPESAIRRADQALYQAKAQGRDRVMVGHA